MELENYLELMTVNQAAKYIHTHRNTILYWIKTNKIDYMKISNKLFLVQKEELDNIIAKYKGEI